MRSKRVDQGWIVAVLALWAAPVWAQDTKKDEDPSSQKPITKVIRGRAVDPAGCPVVGITLGTHWIR